jgi:hypothetical protein
MRASFGGHMCAPFVVWAAVACAEAWTLTPDLRLVPVAKGDSTELPQATAESVIQQPAIEELAFLCADVVAVGTIDRIDLREIPTSQGNVWDESIEMTVDHCLKGSCTEQLSFQGATPFRHPGVEYKPGEHVLLTLFWGDGRFGRRLAAQTEGSKYLVDSNGVVVRKGIPLAQFEREIGDLLAPRAPRNLLEQAQVVAVGTVLAVVEAEGQEEVRPIGARTLLVTVGIAEWFKGRTAIDTLVIVPPALVRGQPWERVEFAPAEEVLLFLNPRPDGRYELVGNNDGKHRLGDPTTNQVLDAMGWRRS